MTADIGQPGQIIDGKYRITRLLGSGGMGAVYEGENVRIRRKVAIKMLHGSVSSQPEVVARFEREAQAAALVGSEHICEVLDLGELPDASRYMVMEYLEGDTLSGLIKKSGRLTPAQSIPILLQILEALGAAHAAGIIHRDLKPDNVFIIPQKGAVSNFVKILDFGVSKFSQLGGEAMNVTRAGAVVGTPYYMSPEQARGSSAIDQRTDIYAIGVLLYQASTGQVPYQAETFNELLFKIVLEVAPPPQVYAPDIDPEFAAIIQRAMAREPDQRYQTCVQFRDALAQFQAMRVNPLPQFSMPARPPTLSTPGPGPGVPARTEALQLSQLPGQPVPFGNHPSGASWPGLPPPDPTVPMQPGLAIASQSGVGAGVGAAAPVATQSGASWAAASNASNLGVSAPPPMATSNSWGNASSTSATGIPLSTSKPKSKVPMVLGVVAVAALLGVGGTVAAVMMMGKPSGSDVKAQAGTTAVVKPTAAPVVNAAPPPPVSAAATAAAVPVETAAPSAEPSAVATASAGASAPGLVPSVKPIPGKMPVAASAKPATTSAPKGKTTKSKGGGNDLGY